MAGMLISCFIREFNDCFIGRCSIRNKPAVKCSKIIIYDFSIFLWNRIKMTVKGTIQLCP